MHREGHMLAEIPEPKSYAAFLYGWARDGVKLG